MHGVPVTSQHCMLKVHRLTHQNCQQVQMAPDCIGDEVQAMVHKLQPGQVLLLENVRFHKQEEKNDPEFAKQVRLV